MVSFVKNFGNKWSTLSKIYNKTRSDHDVKNRFRVITRKRVRSSAYELQRKDIIGRTIIILRKACPEKNYLESLVDKE